MTNEIITAEAYELLLFADNDHMIYSSCFLPTILNLARKQRRGQYDPEKAVKAWKHVMDAAAKKYTDDLTDGLVPWNKLFTVADRMAAARETEKLQRSELAQYLA